MSVYWMVTYVFYFMQYAFYVAFLWILSAAANVHAFQLHSPFVLVLFFILWGNLLITFTFLLSVFFTR